jgi:signal peptidase I
MEDRTAGFVSCARRVVWRVALELITAVVPALVVALAINVTIAEAVTVKDGPSMEPNLYRGYRVMTEKVSYGLHPPRRGDVVVIERPDGEESLIKRVVALSGEEVGVHAGHTWVNGHPIHEHWVTEFGGREYPPTVVPSGYVFVLGDNRPVSHDSRAIGPVPIESIRGRAWLIYWPLSEFRLLP